MLNRYYYLGNIEYINISIILTLFRKIRYYLKEQYLASLALEILAELYNLYYISLYNKIKRIFSVLKRYFLILYYPKEYSILT